MSAPKPAAIVLSGPSGCGKSTLAARLQGDARVVFSVSDTTRAPRPGEVDGKHYRFISRAEFEEGIGAGEYLEYAEVHGNLYGTPRRPLQSALAEGRWVLLDIDVQGAAQLRARGLEGIFIMIIPPSMEVLRARLEGRGTEGPEALELRLANARRELARRDLFDHLVCNDSLERALEEILHLTGLGADRGRS